MSLELRCPPVDCAVLGGGPAGAATATRLAQLGHSVCLFEYRPGGHPRAAESLPVAILPVLDCLGVGETVQRANLLRPCGALVRWSGPDVLAIDAREQPSFVVNRDDFDAALLTHAAANGVVVRRDARVTRTARQDGGGWLIEAEMGGRMLRVPARTLAIANGRRPWLGAKRHRRAPPTIALCARLRLAVGRLAESRIEAGGDWWCWTAPLPDGLVQMALFLGSDHAALRAQSSLEHGLRGLLSCSFLLQNLAAAPLYDPVRACDASRTMVSPVVGDDFIRVGDAAFTIDPLSSQGVMKAVLSGAQGAVVMNTLLRRPGEAEAAKAFCRARQQECVTRDAETAGAYYAKQAAVPSSSFWLARSAPAVDRGKTPIELPDASLHLQLAGTAAIVDEPVISGNFVRMQPALKHPELERPIAFVRDVSVATLLPGSRSSVAAGELIRRWRHQLAERDVASFFGLLWQRGVLVPADARA